MSRASLLIAALVLALPSCFDAHGMLDDGGPASSDSGLDAAVTACVPAGTLDVLEGVVLSAEPARDAPSTSIIRALATADGVAILAQQTSIASTGGQGRVIRILLLSRAGELRSNVEVARDDIYPDGTLDLVLDGAVLRVVGAERRAYAGSGEVDEVWTIAVDGGFVSPRRVLESAEPGAIRAVAAATEPDGVAIYTVRGTSLHRHRLTADALDGDTELAALSVASFDDRARLAVVSSGETTCATITGFPSGALNLIRIDSGEVTSNERLAERGVYLLPVPEVRGGGCAVAWFEPDVEMPTRGRVRLRDSSGGVVGWGGTTPFGIGLVPGVEAAIVAVPSTTWPGEVDVHILQIGEDICATPEPALRFSTGSIDPPLGAVVTAPGDPDSLVLLVSAPDLGAVSVARIEN